MRGVRNASSSPALLLLVFVAGASSLASEIAAARLLAPHFGASTFIWANTIAVVLVALSAGYWWGGRLADRHPQERTPAPDGAGGGGPAGSGAARLGSVPRRRGRRVRAHRRGRVRRLAAGCARARGAAGRAARHGVAVGAAPGPARRRPGRRAGRKALRAVDGREPRGRVPRGAGADPRVRHPADVHRDRGGAGRRRRLARQRAAARARRARRARGRSCPAAGR